MKNAVDGTRRSGSLRARRFLCVLLLAATVLLALVVRPIASALFLATAMAGALWPMHQRLSKMLRNRRGLSAAALVLAAIVVLLGPIVAFSAFAITESSEGLTFLSDSVRSEGVAGLVEYLPTPLSRLAHQVLDRLPVQSEAVLARSIQKQLNAQVANAAKFVGATLSATGAFFFQTGMMLIRRGMHMNGAVVFFALVGGFSAFGGVGLLLGPLVVTLFLSLTRMYQRDFAPRALNNSGPAGRTLAGTTKPHST